MTEWPHLRRSGEWYDSAGTPFDPDKHFRKKGESKPTVNKDGTFRKKPKQKIKSDPLQENQLLGTFKNHVHQAGTEARLNELSTLAGMMHFTGDEESMAQEWIRTRRGELKA